MEEIKMLIFEWYKEKEIVERKERVKSAFLSFFKIEPLWIGIENKKAIAHRFIKGSEIPNDLKSIIKEILGTVESRNAVFDGIELTVSETTENDHAWREELGVPEYGFILRRVMVKNGFQYSIGIKYYFEADC